MNTHILKPFALTTLCLALASCGGESGNFINENDSAGVTTSTSCNTSATDCFGFVLDYPVSGINFTCSSDTVNNFITLLSGNTVTGACKIGDKATFTIKGRNTNNQISLGTVDLNKLSVLKISEFQQLGIIDLATALTGQQPTQLNVNDNTIKVAMALVKIFQALGVQQAANVVGDVQPIDLSENLKADLSKATGSVGVNNYLDGSYASIIQPWVDVSGISDAQAFKVVTQLVNIGNAGTYQSDFLPFPLSGQSSSTVNFIEGFHGTGSGANELIANMYLLTDRTGNTFGYGMQWKGVPTTSSATDNFGSNLARVSLLTLVSPEKMTANAQQNWVNPFSKQIGTAGPFSFNVADSASSRMNIGQGKLLNNYIVAGTEAVYKATTKLDAGVAADYGKWSQTSNGASQFTGSLDISKTSPITYLDNRVFKTTNNVSSGEKYFFPLYTDLTFSFDDTSVTPVKLGIVIDENGDIRSNIGPAATADDLSAGNTCATIPSANSTTLVDSNNVQQFRIGSTGAANFTDTDKSLTIRMILADPAFRKLEGVIVGLNQNLAITGSTSSSVSTSGVKINLNNLLKGAGEGRPVTITAFNSTSTAQWANVYAAYQLVYNNQTAKQNSTLPNPTADQQSLAKRVSGAIDISLPACYTAMLPSMVKPAAP